MNKQGLTHSKFVLIKWYRVQGETWAVITELKGLHWLVRCPSGGAVFYLMFLFGWMLWLPHFALMKDRALNILLCGCLGSCANVALKCLRRSETAESGEMPIFNFNTDGQAALHRGRINLQCLSISISPPPQHLILSDFGEERRDQEETRYSKEALPLASLFRFVYKMYFWWLMYLKINQKQLPST